MFDGLGRREKACIERRHSLEVLDDLGAFFGDAVDRRTGFAPCRLADDPENLFETFHLAFGFPEMFDEGLLQLFRLCSLRHLWKRLEDLVLGKIDILERLVKEVAQQHRLFGHVQLQSCVEEASCASAQKQDEDDEGDRNSDQPEKDRHWLLLLSTCCR